MFPRNIHRRMWTSVMRCIMRSWQTYLSGISSSVAIPIMSWCQHLHTDALVNALTHACTRTVKTGMHARNLTSNWCSSLQQVTIDFDCLHFCWCVVCILDCLHLCWCVRSSSLELCVLLTKCCWILWIVLLNFNRPTRIWPAFLKATEIVVSTSLHEVIN